MWLTLGDCGSQTMLGSGFLFWFDKDSPRTRARRQETRVDFEYFVQGVYALTASSEIYNGSAILEHLSCSVALWRSIRAKDTSTGTAYCRNMSTSSLARSTALNKSNFSLPVEIQLKVIDYYLENLIGGNGNYRPNIDE